MDRLKLLLDTNVIRSDTYSKAKEIESIIVSKYGNSEKVIMLITHYAMALERYTNGETIEPFDNMTIDKLKCNDKYNEAMHEIEYLYNKTGVKLSDTEEQYILLHLMNVIK
jgi:transcriptional regulatory protein LevR